LSPGAHVACDYEVNRLGAEEERAGRLPGLLARHAPGGEPVTNLAVEFLCLFGEFLEPGLPFSVPEGWRYDRQLAFLGDVPLGFDRERQVAVPGQLSQQRPGDSPDEESGGGVLEHAEMLVVDDVCDVVPVPGGGRVGPVPRLVAESACGLCELVCVGCALVGAEPGGVLERSVVERGACNEGDFH